MRLYLFRGELIETASMKNPHAMSITKATKIFFGIFDPGKFDIRVQMPFDVPGNSMPEPDLLVCTIADGQRMPHPARAELVIEVAESSIDHDRDKALEYAAAGVIEYWIIDLNDRCIEVYRNPVSDRTATLGFRYPPPTIAKENEVLIPMSATHVTVKVSDLLA
jgi:Uma2 family endonuclease